MSFLFLMFSLQQNWRTRGWNRFCSEVGIGVAQTMYTHVSKCKNDKIKKEHTQQQMLVRMQGKRNPHTLLVGM
jgi:hypothetical protein